MSFPLPSPHLCRVAALNDALAVFFGLFGITNRASSLIGPNVCSAIINRTGNSWDAFIFLFILCFAAALVITLFVDMDKGRAQAVQFSIDQRGLTAEVRAEQTIMAGGSGMAAGMKY